MTPAELIECDIRDAVEGLRRVLTEGPIRTGGLAERRVKFAFDVLTGLAENPPSPCPHVVTGDEGTSYCTLAESGTRR